MSTQLGQTIVGTIVLASLYAVVGIGFVILYKATRVLNFAQGSLMLVGAVVFSGLLGAGVPWGLAIPLALVALALLGALVYVLAFRRLVGAEPFTLVIATLGLSVAITTVVLIISGPGIKTLPPLLARTPLFSLGALEFSTLDVFCVVMSVVVIVVLELALRRSRLGIEMRAVADSPLLAGLVKVNVHRMSAIAWAVASLCAGVAGIAYAMRLSVDPVGLTGLGLLAFPAVLLGGLDSIRGALVGGLLLAVAQNAASFVFGGLWSDVAAYAVLLLVLLLRPNGLFGSAPVVRL